MSKELSPLTGTPGALALPGFPTRMAAKFAHPKIFRREHHSL
jgi:hypothetical protein